jgi:LmbE family N-acetylglucosaminyl deacetylase
MVGQAVTAIVARRILILAPHPDDEIVACGIAARRARTEGAQFFVLYLTTGVPPREVLWPWQRRGFAARIARRRDEALAVAALFGLEPVGFLDIPSRGLMAQLDAAAASVELALGETQADCLWVPAFEGAHQDHDAANALAAKMRDRLPIWEFAAYNHAGGKLRSNRFIDARGGVIELHLSREEAALKRRALASMPRNVAISRIFSAKRKPIARCRATTTRRRRIPERSFASASIGFRSATRGSTSPRRRKSIRGLVNGVRRDVLRIRPPRDLTSRRPWTADGREFAESLKTNS